MDKICYTPIGKIHTPFKNPKNMPIQPVGASGILGKIEIDEKFVPGLKDLDKFSHIILIYHFHRSEGYQLEMKPFLENEKHGVFSIRAPKRPNPIGFSIVKLKKIEKNLIHIENVDILDGTPLLDIKPYVPKFDIYDVDSIGWLEKHHHKANKHRSDDRFLKSE